MEYQQESLTTSRLTTAYYRKGEGNPEKLLLLHGNMSSSVFFLPVIDQLAEKYDVVALDLRCFGDSSALPIDAKNGYRDWSEDVAEFVDELDWDDFYLLGWSMGGDIAMQYAIDYYDQLKGLILVNPGSPYGFGGTYDKDGKMLKPKGLASGAGLVQPMLMEAVTLGKRNLIDLALKETIFFSPGYRIPKKWEEPFKDAVAKTRVGKGMYPGEVKTVLKWPFFAAGDQGICNAMSSVHGNVSGIIEIDEKPPILWIRGKDDVMISDHSICDLAVLGQMSLFPVFPGERSLPSQPMVSQTRHVLDEYSNKGGEYKEVVIPGAHCCFLESPKSFVEAINDFTDQ